MAGRGPGGGLGAGGGFAPMAGGGRGQGAEDTEHRRPSYTGRAHLRRRVYQQLETSGLARGERLEPELHDALALLARAPIWVDMHWLAEPGQRHEPGRRGPLR